MDGAQRGPVADVLACYTALSLGPSSVCLVSVRTGPAGGQVVCVNVGAGRGGRCLPLPRTGPAIIKR